MDRYESGTEADELEDFEGDINELYDDEYYKESEPIPKLYSNATAAATRNNTIGNMTFNTNRISPNGSLIQFESETGSVNPVMTHSADLNLEGKFLNIFLLIYFVAFHCGLRREIQTYATTKINHKHLMCANKLIVHCIYMHMQGLFIDLQSVNGNNRLCVTHKTWSLVLC